MRLRYGPPPPPREWDRRDPDYDDVYHELRSPVFWLGAAVCFFGFLALCVLMIVTMEP